jgi:diguanylate cyclase (GGDEF)-like protein
MAFLCMSVITAGLGGYAVHSVAEGARLVAETFDNSLMSISFARAAAVDFATMEGLAARRRLVTGAASQDRLSARIDELSDTLRDDLDVAAERSRSERAAAAARSVDQAAREWRSAEQALRQEDPAAANWKPLDSASAAVAKQVDLLVNFTAGDAFLYRERALGAIGRDRMLNVAATLAALLLSGITVVVLARRIISPLADASAAATRIAHGELETEIPAGGSDELGVLLRAMAVMRDSIRTMMGHEIAQRRSAQGRLVDAIEGSYEGVVLVDDDERIVIANSQLGRFFPAVAAELQPGACLTEVVAEPAVRDSLASLVPTEVRLDDGRWLRISRSGNREGGYVAICGDITVEKEREAAITQTNRLFDAALSNMSQGLCLYDGQQRLLVSNRQFAELYRLAPDVVRPGLSFRDVLALSAAAGNYEDDTVDALVAGRLEFVADRPLGTQLQELSDGRVVAISHEPMDDGGWVATYEDVTERRRAEARINFMARHDALTNLPNRVLFRESLDMALSQLGRGHGFAVLFVDLDHFKSINDTLGHPIGDRVLVATAERLQACARETDTVARLGGDEFAIVQVGIERPDDALELAGRIARVLGDPFEVDGHQVLISASMGIAMGGTDGTSVDTLLKNADLALYRAKEDDRGAFRCFEPEMDARVQRWRALELDLRRALANDEFDLYFQPLIDLRDNRLSGFEALIRWRHPERGMVSPAEFIPVAEKSGLIVGIGEWVIRRACAEAVTWAGSLKIAVNVSPLQFKSPRLLRQVAEALETSGLPPGRLELEITESVLLADNDASLATLRRLHELGTRISMDDFGTGYSSLSYLRSFPFDKIKIDQSFVRDLDVKDDSRAIVRAIISLGFSLGIDVLAEGVETAKQLDLLRREGCGEVQGYFFSPPRPGPEIPAMIARLGGELRAMPHRGGSAKRPARTGRRTVKSSAATERAVDR